jgi:hypothetical protein
MKNLNVSLLFLVFIFHLQDLNAQTINWNSLDNANHIINANFGLDYSISYGVGYSYKLKTRLPIAISANFSMPSGENLFDDFKTKIGAEILLFNRSKFAGTVSINGIYRRNEMSVVKLQNFGGEVKGRVGYFKPKWFVAAEAGFDKAIVTNFRHSKSFIENIYPDVRDGWYEPSTGGNFLYGLQGGYSFKRTDITLNLGRVVTQDMNASPLIPYYLTVGFNVKIP